MLTLKRKASTIRAKRTKAANIIFHDERDHNDQNICEYVELKPLSAEELRQVKTFVNFYEGKTLHANGTAIVHYRGKTYQSGFSLKATSGNHGKDYNRRSQSDYWAEIDVAKIVGLNPGLNP